MHALQEDFNSLSLSGHHCHCTCANVKNRSIIICRLGVNDLEENEKQMDHSLTSRNRMVQGKSQGDCASNEISYIPETRI